MSDPLRLAIVGVGRMGAFHAETLATMDTIDVVAVVDRRPGIARQVAEKVGSAYHSSTSALLERDDVEAWLVASSTLTHGEIVGSALDAGLHILCEKPLSLDLGESEGLGARAAASGTLLQIGFWRRFAPPWMAARQAVIDGAIGRPLMLRLSQWDADPPPPSFCDPLTSGGLAIDCGVHEFDLIGWLTGLSIESVTTRNLPLVDAAIGAVGDVDNLLAVLDLSGGAVATVDLSRNCRYGDDVRTEILGEDGAIFVDLLPTGRARLANASGIEVIEGSETDDAFAAGIRAQAACFAAAARGDPVDVPDASASTRAVAVGRAVQESAATGEPVVFAV
jgi:myo-inositol 2-dehydrogenase/D-chiro-inositol 1-dehydrogenase